MCKLCTNINKNNTVLLSLVTVTLRPFTYEYPVSTWAKDMSFMSKLHLKYVIHASK